jgi:hypothetical protein
MLHGYAELQVSNKDYNKDNGEGRLRTKTRPIDGRETKFFKIDKT